MVEAPCTSLDELMFDYIVFVMQRPKRRAEHLVSSRHPVFVFMLPSAFVRHLAQPELLALSGFCKAVPLLFILEHVHSRTRLFVAMNTQTMCLRSFMPNNWPECLINMLAHLCAYTLSCISSTTHLVLSCLFFVFSFLQARVLHMHAYVRTHMYMQARSCLHVYAHIGAIMPARICTHRRDHACTYMPT